MDTMTYIIYKKKSNKEKKKSNKEKKKKRKKHLFHKNPLKKRRKMQ